MADERNFRVWIHPLTGRASKGLWHWRIVVQRLSDGLTRQSKASGGWLVAEAVANRLMEEIESCPEC